MCDIVANGVCLTACDRIFELQGTDCSSVSFR